MVELVGFGDLDINDVLATAEAEVINGFDGLEVAVDANTQVTIGDQVIVLQGVAGWRTGGRRFRVRMILASRIGLGGRLVPRTLPEPGIETCATDSGPSPAGPVLIRAAASSETSSKGGTNLCPSMDSAWTSPSFGCCGYWKT